MKGAFMKKNYDYEKTESWIKSGFDRAEKNAAYKGSITKEALSTAVNKTETKKEKSGFFTSPALRIAGVFLVATAVGGGTFGVLKYLEYKGAQITPPDTETSVEAYETGKPDDTDEPAEAVLLSEINGVKKYDYSKMTEKYPKASCDGDPNNFVLLLTGGQVYSANVFKYDERTKVTSENYTAEYFRPDVYSQPAVPFGGDLVLYNNVDGREMTVVHVRVKYPNGQTTILSSVEEAFRTVFKGRAGTYEVTVDVSWDETDGAKLNKGDKYTVYRAAFDLVKEKSYINTGKNVYQWYSAHSTGRDYVYVNSDGWTYQIDAARTKYTKLISTGKVQKGFSETGDNEKIIYSDDFKIESNVIDREMTVISVTVSESQFDADHKKEMTLPELYEYLKEAEAGTYYVTLELTWDKYPQTEPGDEALFYKSTFTVVKEGSYGEKASAFFFVSVLRLDQTEDAGSARLKTGYETTAVQRVVSDEADALGWKIYKYNINSANSEKGYSNCEAGVYVIDKSGSCILNFEPKSMLFAPTALIYARETPSGHSMFFFTALQSYSGLDVIDTMVYAYDTVTGELTLFTTPRTETEVGRRRNAGLLVYDKENGRILFKQYYGIFDVTQYERGEFEFDEKFYRKSSKLFWDGEQYKFRSVPDPEKAADTAEETQPEPPEDFDPTGRLIIKAGYKSYYPGVILTKEYKNGRLYKETNSGELPETYLCGIGAALEVEYNNRERRIYAVTVNGDKTFDDFKGALDYIEKNKAYYPDTVTVTAEITWDAEALTDPDADRTTYTFEFAVTFTDPDAETQTPESDPTFEDFKNYLAVEIGNEKYYPEIISRNVYKDDQATVTRYLSGREDVRLSWRSGEESISVENQIYSAYRIYGVTVNGTNRFDTAEQAFEYIADGEGYYDVEVEVGWNIGSPLDPNADKTTYTFAFTVQNIKS